MRPFKLVILVLYVNSFITTPILVSANPEPRIGVRMIYPTLSALLAISTLIIIKR